MAMIVKQLLSNVSIPKALKVTITNPLWFVFSFLFLFLVDCVDGVVLKHPFVKFNSGVKQSLMSTIIAAEGSGDIEPDQSQLERITDSPHPIHMKILLGDDQVAPGPTPEFYGKIPIRTGSGCKRLDFSGFQ
jgi:hypothetical protein